MAIETIEMVSRLFSLFTFSFIVALTGAMAPGPLLTYTIMKTARADKRGWTTGFWVILGHGFIEMIIIALLLMGFSCILTNAIVVRVIGILGGVVLACFGVLIIRDLKNGKVRYDFLEKDSGLNDKPQETGGQVVGNTILGGALVSMSNPYWWIWWATIGSSFMIQYQVDFNNLNKLAAFFTGHVAGDLFWYIIVSVLIYFGIKHLNKKIYYGLLACCGCFMIGFGVYLGSMPLLSALS